MVREWDHKPEVSNFNPIIFNRWGNSCLLHTLHAICWSLSNLLCCYTALPLCAYFTSGNHSWILYAQNCLVLSNCWSKKSSLWSFTLEFRQKFGGQIVKYCHFFEKLSFLSPRFMTFGDQFDWLILNDCQRLIHNTSAIYNSTAIIEDFFPPPHPILLHIFSAFCIAFQKCKMKECLIWMSPDYCATVFGQACLHFCPKLG